MRLIAVVGFALAVWLGTAQLANAQSSLRVGVLLPHAGRAVLAADGAEPGPDTKAHPVLASAIAPFAIRGRLAEPTESSPGPLVLVGGNPVPVYATDLPDGLALDSLPVVVLLGRTPPAGLSVSSCTSGEGMHVSLWSGSGSSRIRRWSAYVYLGYDTEPTCTDSELAR